MNSTKQTMEQVMMVVPRYPNVFGVGERDIEIGSAEIHDTLPEGIEDFILPKMSIKDFKKWIKNILSRAVEGQDKKAGVMIKANNDKTYNLYFTLYGKCYDDRENVCLETAKDLVESIKKINAGPIRYMFLHDYDPYLVVEMSK